MSAPATAHGVALSPAIVEGVAEAVENTLASICGARPERLTDDPPPQADIIGIITFVGDAAWSFSILMPEATAVALIQTFVGMEIPFDSADMGDAAGELANVIAGDIVARLDARRVKAKMSLPLVARGQNVKVFGVATAACVRLGYRGAQGPFWIKLAAEEQAQLLARQPGT
ncbi:MAG TPA: chemotaxis protein CheX [Gemmataceae bacterium]|nr:chemotaxis protein CheX [Gemmataceae bacterium]